MDARSWRLAAAACVALLVLPLLPADAGAQSRTSGVRISRGHVYVGGRHVGVIRASDGRTGLARIVNPAVGRLGPGFRRPPDVRAGTFGPHDRFGNRFFDSPGSRRGGHLGSGRFPRIGANGILLGGEIPLLLPVFCPACELVRHPFLSAFPLFSVFPAVRVETVVSERTGHAAPWPGAAAPAEEPGPRPQGPRIGRIVLEEIEAEPRKEWEGPCVAVRVAMAAGTVHWLRVPLRSLDADSPVAARELLEARVRAGRPLQLTGFSGGGLTVPAGLVEGIETEACPSE